MTQEGPFQRFPGVSWPPALQMRICRVSTRPVAGQREVVVGFYFYDATLLDTAGGKLELDTVDHGHLVFPGNTRFVPGAPVTDPCGYAWQSGDLAWAGSGVNVSLLTPATIQVTKVHLKDMALLPDMEIDTVHSCAYFVAPNFNWSTALLA